jgi:benzoate 4-monooxygenase
MVAVDKRKSITVDPARKDVLYYLLPASDPEKGGMLQDSEIKAEALTQLVAGSDTTGNTIITHVIDMMMLHPEKVHKLQAELVAAFPCPLRADWVPSFAECEDLPYVNGVVRESLRLRMSVSFGLPRVISKGGAKVCGEFFKAGTVLSTPTYTTHRDPRVWGQYALDYEPGHWAGAIGLNWRSILLASVMGQELVWVEM